MNQYVSVSSAVLWCRFALGGFVGDAFAAGVSVKNDDPQGPPPPDPPPREFKLKPTEFERVNRPADATPGNAPIDVRQLYKQANASPPLQKASPPPAAENDVHAILRANVDEAKAQGHYDVIPERQRVSRRTRDFWMLLIGGNVLMVGALAVLHRNPVTLVFGFSAMVFCSLALTWVMWFVMDDY